MSQHLIEVVDQDGHLAHLILTSAATDDSAERGYIVTIHGLDGIPIVDAEWPIAQGVSIEEAERKAEEWAQVNGWRRRKPSLI